MKSHFDFCNAKEQIDNNLQNSRYSDLLTPPVLDDSNGCIFPQTLPPNVTPEIFPQNANTLELSEDEKLQKWYKPTIHFYLRCPNSPKPQPITAYIRLTPYLRYKLPLGVKALPSHWDKHAQRCTNQLNDPITIKRNHAIANKVILDTLTIFNGQLLFDNSFLEYICNKSKNIGDKTEIRGLFPHLNKLKGKNNMKNTNLIIKPITDYIGTKRESTQNQYRVYFKRFLKYLTDNGLPATFDSITYKTIYNYARELEKEMKIMTANSYLSFIKKTLQELSKNPNIDYDYDYKVNEININKTDLRKEADEKEARTIIVSDEQIKALKEVGNLTPAQKVVRDLFILKTYFGCRYSDLYKTLKPENYKELDGNRCIQYYDKKEGHRGKKKTATIILNKLSAPLYDKYSKLYKAGKLKEIVTRVFNDSIKNIAKKSGAFNEIRKGICRRKNIYEDLPLYELLSSHDTRHTYITKCQLEGIPTEVIARTTGHKSLEVIDNCYTHITEEQQLKLAIESNNKYFNNSNAVEVRSNKVNSICADIINKMLSEGKDIKYIVEIFELISKLK